MKYVFVLLILLVLPSIVLADNRQNYNPSFEILDMSEPKKNANVVSGQKETFQKEYPGKIYNKSKKKSYEFCFEGESLPSDYCIYLRPKEVIEISLPKGSYFERTLHDGKQVGSTKFRTREKKVLYSGEMVHWAVAAKF